MDTINPKEIYEISVAQADGTHEVVKISGLNLQQILTCYFNVTRFSQAAYIKMEGGAIINNTSFDKVIQK